MEYIRIYGEIGERIRSRRHQLKKTQEELAKQVLLSRPSLANIEGGRQAVLVHQLILLAEALELSVQDLLPMYRPSKADDSGIIDDTISKLMPAGLSPLQEQQLKALFVTPTKRVLTSTNSRREHKG